MEDLWRVKDVLDAIKRHKERVAPESKKGPVAEGYRMACDHITELLSRFVPTVQNEHESRWIPVEERLPENGEETLCHFDDGLIATAMYWDEYNDWDIWQRTGSVTHWMPLPEPPKQKGD